MSVVKKVAFNSLILLATKFLSIILSLFVSVALVRYLGAEGNGKFSIVFAYISFFQILTSFGIDQIVIREVAKDNNKQITLIGTAMLMKIVFSMFAILSSWVVLQYMNYPKDVRMFIYIASFAMLFSFNTTFVGLFQAHYKVIYYALPELVLTAATSGVILFLIICQAPIFHFIFVQTIGVVPITLFYVCFLRKIGRFTINLRVDLNICKSLLKESWPIFLAAICITINSKIDQLLLFNMLGQRELGLYAAIVKLIESLNTIPVIYMVSIFPLLSSCFSKAGGQFNKVYNLSFKYMSMLIIPIAFGSSILAKELILVIYGDNFLEASGVFSILIWSEIFVFLGTVNASIFYASGLQKYILLFTFLGSLINIILNIILIPKYGILGAAIASTISYGASPIILIQYFIKRTRQIAIDYFKSTIKPTLCSIPMCVFIYMFHSLNIFILVFASSLVYLFFLIVTKGISEADIEYLRHIMNLESAKPVKIRA